ncbi:hypothetical protein CBR_g8816 [Chara braunii]|uniref:Reverse transcriptase domain-containing protein n=1 Tax=Chara braunii TaxID=69332 RepID=A0A388KMV9_CHABU|nr:hypothetical protein CBR_g8816 [Chara braunii]|eukprot:GBG71396.1 hypothetical protein CBR_g8816 [Chara braunii]
MLREIRSYIDESEDDSEEVREEAVRLVDAIEKRKRIGKKRGFTELGAEQSTGRLYSNQVDTPKRKRAEALKTKKAGKTPVEEAEDEQDEALKTSMKGLSAACSNEVGVTDLVHVEKMLISRFSPALNNIGRKQGGSKKSRRKGKRERGKRSLFADQGTVISFKIDGQVSSSLLEIIWELRGIVGTHQIESSGGKMWSDGWRTLRSKIGETTIEMGGVAKCIKYCRSMLEKGGVFMVKKVWIASSAIEHRRNYLKKMLARPYRIKQAYKMNSSKVIALYRTATFFTRKKSRSSLKLKIARVIRAKFGEDIQKRWFVRISFSPLVRVAKVRDLAAKIIEQVIPDISTCRYVSARVRVVIMKRRTVGDLIHNHGVWVKQDATICTCSTYDLPRVQGHVRARLDEVAHAPRFLHNSRNVTRGRERIDNVLKGVVEAAKPWAKGRRICIDDEEVQACWMRKEGNAAGMTEEQVKSWIRWNGGYVIEEREDCEVLNAGRRDYVASGLTKIAEWGKNGRIGNAYVIPKDKDLDRWRPIAPATTDPARLASARLGRAVRYMLICLKKSCHFDLTATEELCQVLRRCQKSLGKGNDVALARSYDIKDMFAKLSHASVHDSVDWVLNIHESKGLRAIRVSRRGRECKMTRSMAHEDGYVTMEFELVRRMLEYDLSHAYVKSGSVTLRQVFGIPMGRSSSPALACLVCTRAEAVFLSSLGNDRHLVGGVHIIDDAAIFVGVRSSDIRACEKAAGILTRFENAHDDELKLVRKDKDTNSFEFLGAVVYVGICPIEIRVIPKTRNQSHLSQLRKIRIHSLQDYNSFSFNEEIRSGCELPKDKSDGLHGGGCTGCNYSYGYGSKPPGITPGGLSRFSSSFC